MLLAGGLIFYSQTMAFAFDEGFHLVAAQLILNGKRPYLDFLFPQTPLNAYWNALWMRLFTDTWRVAHLVATIETSAALLLAVDYVFRRMPEKAWRTPSALFVACAIGLNVEVVQFGTVGQAYGLCLLLIVAAFRTAVLAAQRSSLWLVALTGLLSAAAAESSLLTAPVVAVLFIWLMIAGSAGDRIRKACAFAAGVSIASIPLLSLFLQSPNQVVFGVIKYHALFRTIAIASAWETNLAVFMAWIDSGQALLLILLAAGGIAFVRSCGWSRAQKLEFYLCGALAVTLTLHLFTAMPTFTRYFLLTVPFLSILAAAGLCALAERLHFPRSLAWTAGVAVLLMGCDLTKALYEGRDDFAWSDVEAIAAKVDSVIPKGATIYAEELVYFATRRTPPEGMECHDTHKLTSLANDEAARLHVVPGPERDRMAKAGLFQAMQSCDDKETARFEPLYANKAEYDSGCALLWGFK